MNTHTETSSELGAIRHRKKTSVLTIPLRHRGQQSQAHSFFSWALGLRTTTFSADTVTNSQPQKYTWIRQCFKNNTVINNNNKTVLAVVVIKFSPDSFLFGFTFFSAQHSQCSQSTVWHLTHTNATSSTVASCKTNIHHQQPDLPRPWPQCWPCFSSYCVVCYVNLDFDFKDLWSSYFSHTFTLSSNSIFSLLVFGAAEFVMFVLVPNSYTVALA